MTRHVVQANNGAKQTFTPTWPGNSGEWSWQDRAACNGVDELTQYEFTHLPHGRGVAAEHARRLADEYCNGCPVLARCREWANQDTYFTGVAGGRAYKDRNGRTYRRARDKQGREDG